MSKETRHAYLSNYEQFIRSNFDFQKFSSAMNEIVQKTKDEFISSLLKIVGDPNPNQVKKEMLNNFRVKLAINAIERFNLKKDIQIQNRTSCKQMANDIWFITNSIVDGRLNNETHDVIKYNGKNKSLNDSVIINEPIYCETNEDLKKFLGEILDEIQALKASNASILSIVEELRTENANMVFQCVGQLWLSAKSF